MNLTEMLVTQQNVDQISARFGLTEEQTLEAMAAVIPAFSEGLKRQTRTPESAAGLVRALASGQHAQYAEHPEIAASKQGVNEGNAILGHLFGNKQVSRAVASQASAATGLSQSTIKNLLPVLASMVMGSIFKGASSSSAGVGSSVSADAAGGLGGMLGQAAGGGLLGSILESVAGGLLEGAKGATPRRRSPTRRRSSSKSGSLEDLLGQILGGASTSSRQRKPLPRTRSRRPTRRTKSRQRSSNDGLGGILDDLLGGSQPRQGRRSPSKTPMPRKRVGGSRNGGLGDIFGEFLEPGGNTSREQQRNTGSIFDEFLKG